MSIIGTDYQVVSYDKNSLNDNKKETQEPSLFLTKITFTFSEYVFVSRKGLHTMLILKLYVWKKNYEKSSA